MGIISSRCGASGLVFVAIVSVIALALGALAVSVPDQGVPVVTSQKTTDATSGITLVLSVSPAGGPPGTAFTVSAQVTNDLPRSNNVTGVNDYRGVQGEPVCRSAPIVFEVLRGSYSAQDFSTGKAIRVHGVQNYMCVVGASDLKWYTFQAKSDAFSGVSSGGAAISWSAAISADIVREWSPDLSSSGPLSPGTYTVVAADNWGQVAVVHFTVS